jgi:hypothetical protein
MKKKTGKSGEIARLPMSHRGPDEPASAFMSKEEMLSLLAARGIIFSQKLIGQMRMPPSVYRGKFEKLEFFDTTSVPQPFPYHESDSPSVCHDRKEPAPKWLGRWYMAIVGEEGKESIVLFHRGKRAFLKVPVAEAEEAIPEMMLVQTIELESKE